MVWFWFGWVFLLETNVSLKLYVMLYILLNLEIKYDIINSIMPFTTAWIRRAHTNSEKVRLTIYDKIRHRRFSFNAEFSVDVES